MSLALAALVSAALFAPAPHPEEGLARELTGVRSLAMGGAHRGVGTSNDTLYLNPAGMALIKRYSVELQYGYSPFDGITRLNTSAVDSKSGPVAGGLGYTRERSDPENLGLGLNRFYMGAGYALSPAFALGLTGRYLRGAFTDPAGREEVIDLYNGDVGAMLALSNALTLGVSYNNIMKTEHEALAPPTLGFGVGISGTGFVLAGDVEIDRSEHADNAVTYRTGGEYVLAQAFPLRMGYSRLRFLDKKGAERPENLVAGGLGWFSGSGALDIGFEQSLERAKNWRLLAAFKFFL
jgi:hypothetical protein